MSLPAISSPLINFWITARGKSKGNPHLEDFVWLHLAGGIESASDLIPIHAYTCYRSEALERSYWLIL